MRKRLALALLAFVIVLPCAALAHEGHEHRVMGTVSAIHENHLEVKATDGKTVAFTLSEKTKFLMGKTKATVKDLKVGDRVVVTGTGDKAPFAAKEVRLGSVPARTGSATKQQS